MFEREWARTVLNRALERLRAECDATPQANRFRMMAPSLVDGPGTTRYKELAHRLEMSEAAVKVAIHRMRRRYREAIRAEISGTVDDPEEIDREIRHLLTIIRP